MVKKYIVTYRAYAIVEVPFRETEDGRSIWEEGRGGIQEWDEDGEYDGIDIELVDEDENGDQVGEATTPFWPMPPSLIAVKDA